MRVVSDRAEKVQGSRIIDSHQPRAADDASTRPEQMQLGGKKRKTEVNCRFVMWMKGCPFNPVDSDDKCHRKKSRHLTFRFIL